LAHLLHSQRKLLTHLLVRFFGGSPSYHPLPLIADLWIAPDFSHNTNYTSPPANPSTSSGSTYGSNYGSRSSGSASTVDTAASKYSFSSSSGPAPTSTTSSTASAAPAPAASVTVVRESSGGLDGEYSGVDFGDSQEAKKALPTVEGEDPADAGKFWKIAFYRYVSAANLSEREASVLVVWRMSVRWSFQ
jgi:hypothetical protein